MGPGAPAFEASQEPGWTVVGHQFGIRHIIPEGFKLIAVGERCATPTDRRNKND